MLVAVFGDAHAHADALEAVLGAAKASGAGALWSLGDMVGGGPDAERTVTLTREHCTVALVATTTTARPGRWTLATRGAGLYGLPIDRAGARNLSDAEHRVAAITRSRRRAAMAPVLAWGPT